MKSKTLKGLSFRGEKFYVGIDVHKRSWTVTILTDKTELKTFSQNPSALELSSYLHRMYPEGDYEAVYEAGFNGFGACRALQSLGINCQVIHPADVPTTVKEKLQKSDKVDSRKLARSLRGGELRGIDLPTVSQEADRALIRLRTRIVKDISRIKNRIKSLLFQFGIAFPAELSDYQSRHWSRNYLEWLEGLDIGELSFSYTLKSLVSSGKLLRSELLDINKKIRQLSQSPRYKSRIDLLLTLPGVGIMTGMLLTTQLGDISRFEREDELCSYIGLVPRIEASGERIRTGKMSKRGYKEIKIALIEASWIAIRKDPALLHKFNQLSLRMHKNKAIIRIARKLLNRIRYVLREKKEYQLGTIQ